MKYIPQLLVGFVLGLSAQALAHPASDYYGDKWPRAGTTVVDGYFTTDSGWGPTKKNSVQSGFNHWDFAGGADFKFNFPSGTHANYPGYERADCVPAPNNDIHWDGSIPASSNALAVANACDTDGDGKLDAFVTVFDQGVNWNVGSADPSASEYDLRAAGAHESGHVTGFGLGGKPDHFTGSTLCPEGSTKHAMCATLTQGEMWQRALEIHDEHTFENAYPTP